MKNNLAIKSSIAVLILVLVYALSAGTLTAQSTEKSLPFGSSLKRPKGETKGKTRGQVSQRLVKENLPQPEEILRVNTSLVNLDVLVTDAKGSRTITGLTKDDFVLTEDNQLQTVATVIVGDDAERLPRSLVLIFDRSQSELPYLESSIEAAKMLVNQLAPSDEMAIVTDDVTLAIGFTGDKKALKQTLDSLKKLSLTGYHTRSLQFSALLATLRELIDRDKKRPIIIFQTDGDEVSKLGPSALQNTPSEYDLNTVYSEVEQSRAKIYTVIPNVQLIGIPKEEIPERIRLAFEKGLLARAKYKDMWYGAERAPPKGENNLKGDNNSNAALSVIMNNPQLLEMMSETVINGQTAAARVADLTGGWASFLERSEQAKEIYSRILADINHRYIINYYPANKEQDGRLRKVRIEVRGHPDYVIHGRTSYYAMPHD